jgi:hypothetical protein
LKFAGTKKHKELLQSGNLRKIQHMVLTFPIGLLFLGQWHNICEVTNSRTRRIQDANFCHDNCKNLANMRQVCQGAVGLRRKIMTLRWNNFALFYVVTVIQSMSMTKGTSLLEQSSLFFHCYMLFYITEVKFPCCVIDCSRSLKFNLCGPGNNICIYIENGLFSLFF